MTSPVQISDLPVATTVADSDLLLVRQGLSDFQAEASKVRAIDISAFGALTNPNATDQFLIQRAGTRYSIRFDKVGFVAGTRCWFHQAAAPSGWQIVTGLGDRVLSVAGGTQAYNVAGGSSGGTWQQPGHELSLQEIPNHTHNIICGRDTANEKIVAVKGTKNQNDSPRPRAPTEGITGSSRPLNGTGASHNHGTVYRPLANVGIICQKLT